MPEKNEEPMAYEDVPEDWKRLWKKMGIPEGEFPPGIDDREWFAQFEAPEEPEE
jgi:hypothetical protein